MNFLSEPTIRLLGSSQVITSVYSVIKELVENSLDAGATSIEVKLENYGLDKIEVRDNGSGICAADISVFAKRHFTSKITTHADLEFLASYGFRGEALASLCALSEVTVTTKTTAEDVSLTYSLSSDGDVISTVPSHVGQGTTVCARNLFKNLPVRKQYHSLMKQKKEDLKSVENLLLAYGVIMPKVRFCLRHNKEIMWQKVVMESTAAVLHSVLGKDMSQMIWKKREVEDPEIILELCIPKPGSDVLSLSRSTSDRSFLCINGRPVTIRNIDKLIRQYYNNCHACETSRHPVYYLGITLPSKDLDVNIDPNKTTVMITSMSTLMEQLEEMLLYVYGPLDQAPSWRYRDADDKSTKSSTSSADTDKSNSLIQQLRSFNNVHDDQAVCSKESRIHDIAPEQSSSSPPSVIKQGLAPCSDKQSVPQTKGNSKILHVKPVTKDSDDVEKHSDTAPLLKMPHSKDPQEGHESSLNKCDSGHDMSDCIIKSNERSHDLLKNHSTITVSGDSVSNGDEQKEAEKTENTVKALVVQSTDEETGSKLCKSHEQITSSSEWSHGTSIRGANGAVVQPARLLTPSSAHFPGKRPSCSSFDPSQNEMAPLEKRRRKLCPAQSTLYDTINNVAVKRPVSARDLFMKEKRSSVVEQNPEADYEVVTDMVLTMWNELDDEQRVVFREKCWHDTQRYNREVKAAHSGSDKVTTSVSSKTKTKQTSVRDMVAFSSTQPSPRECKKKSVVHSAVEKKMAFSMRHLQNTCQTSVTSQGDLSGTMRVLARLPSCGAWVCAKGKELCILNADRLSEAVVYNRLINQHCLPVHHCQTVPLTSSSTGGFWTVLEQLVEGQQFLDTFTNVSDSRITHNGFEVKCWKDGGGLCAELVGVCGDIPVYGLKDLMEILELMSQDMSQPLAKCRPLKVVNFLKGEAVRLIRKQAGERSVVEVQSLLEESANLLSAECHSCLHDRPFFHTLLQNIELPASSQPSAESVPPPMVGMSHESDETVHGNSESSSKKLDHVVSFDDLMDFDW